MAVSSNDNIFTKMESSTSSRSPGDLEVQLAGTKRKRSNAHNFWMERIRHYKFNQANPTDSSASTSSTSTSSTSTSTSSSSSSSSSPTLNPAQIVRARVQKRQQRVARNQAIDRNFYSALQAFIQSMRQVLVQHQQPELKAITPEPYGHTALLHTHFLVWINRFSDDSQHVSIFGVTDDVENLCIKLFFSSSGILNITHFNEIVAMWIEHMQNFMNGM